MWSSSVHTKMEVCLVWSRSVVPASAAICADQFDLTGRWHRMHDGNSHCQFVKCGLVYDVDLKHHSLTASHSQTIDPRLHTGAGAIA